MERAALLRIAGNTPMTKALRRCALYTRKSTEEGLEQAFNSLDAQREACAAYVVSQTGEGWRTIATAYDDGGFSGGSMERPALQRLLTDIAAGKIDVVVVYKIDRLTRSLADFARMVELFDRHNVSFVSVTQAFNTTTSMGRLTLNVLLSFAQFEREVTSERIRDKIAASKAKGMWMGGTLPLGYDAPAQDRALIVNEAEAATVRLIFGTYLELGSVHALERWLDTHAIRSKSRLTRKGKMVGGKRFSRGALFHLLRNRTYLGMIAHKGKVYPGMHPAIVNADQFEAVQQMLDSNVRRFTSTRQTAGALLTGRIFDCDGESMSPTFAKGARGKRYRYYVSASLQQGRRPAGESNVIRRVAAVALETQLTNIVHRTTGSAQTDPLTLILRLEVHPRSLQILLPAHYLPEVQSRIGDDEHAAVDPADPSRLRLVVPVRVQLRGGRTWIIASKTSPARPDRVLIKALRAAHTLVRHGAQGFPFLDAVPASPYERRLLRLAFLAPDLQKAILAGRQPPGLTLSQLMANPIPLSWHAQAALLRGEELSGEGVYACTANP